MKDKKDTFYREKEILRKEKIIYYERRKCDIKKGEKEILRKEKKRKKKRWYYKRRKRYIMKEEKEII